MEEKTEVTNPLFKMLSNFKTAKKGFKKEQPKKALQPIDLMDVGREIDVSE